MDSHTLVQTNVVCASACGFALNGLLLFLLARHTPTAMRSYARVMRVHCVSDVLYDLGVLATGVHPVPLGGKVFLVLQGFYLHADAWWGRWLFSWYFWEILIAIALLPIDFFYRFRSVCHNVELSTRTLGWLVFVAYFVTWLHAFPNSLNYLQVGPRAEAADFTRELERHAEFRTARGVPSFGVTVLGGTKALSNFLFILALNCFVVVVIAYTSLRIRAALRSNAHTVRNAKAAELQRQVTRILVLQAVLPLVVICLPTVAVVSLALARVDVPRAGAVAVAVLSWLSAVKPAATIAVVPRYRAFVRSLFCRSATKTPAPTSAFSTVDQEALY
ncbi:hypothetical protein M3Y99_00667800 [Aphelenchoides fujianensis]|nr:hypothetical protein M3Y99_00667800 [Aphelenchoides fujianensis]